MTQKIISVWDKTKGYKSRSGAVLLALYTLIESMAPELIKGQTEQVLRSSIDLLIITGGADWVWSNRVQIIDWFKNIFKKKENGKR